MPHRTFRWYDALLLAGLTIAVLVIFSHPIRVVLEAAHSFENYYGLSLVPALVILTVVFAFQQQAKRQEAAARAAASAAEAVQAKERARDLEELVNFGRSLAESLDLDTVRETVWRNLPMLVRTRRTWLLVRNGTPIRIRDLGTVIGGYRRAIGAGCMSSRARSRPTLPRCAKMSNAPCAAAKSLWKNPASCSASTNPASKDTRISKSPRR